MWEEWWPCAATSDGVRGDIESTGSDLNLRPRWTLRQTRPRRGQSSRGHHASRSCPSICGIGLGWIRHSAPADPGSSISGWTPSLTESRLLEIRGRMIRAVGRERSVYHFDLALYPVDEMAPVATIIAPLAVTLTVRTRGPGVLWPPPRSSRTPPLLAGIASRLPLATFTTRPESAHGQFVSLGRGRRPASLASRPTSSRPRVGRHSAAALDGTRPRKRSGRRDR